MDYTRVIEELIGGYDLSQETEGKKAYRECEEYARQHLKARLEFNAFMAAVADRLGTLPIRRNDFRDAVGEVPEGAKLYLRYDPKAGPELTGNADGLRYLAALLAELAEQAVEHDHVHLYPEETPMYGRTYPLTIYHEPNAWFEELDPLDDREQEEKTDLEIRAMQPSDIGSLCLLGKVPPDMLLTRYKAYRVLSVDRYEGQEVWEKRIRESRARFFLFTVVNDDGVQERLGFDLDDPEVLFFSRQNVALLSAGAS